VHVRLLPEAVLRYQGIPMTAQSFATANREIESTPDDKLLRITREPR
jgi:hypothetical protein